MPAQHVISMWLMHRGTPRDLQAREQLAQALGEDVEVAEPDEVGVFDITIHGGDHEAALQRIWDAVAASGTDDHIVFLEHPQLPEHWRHRAGAP
jgi:hypothetical protein